MRACFSTPKELRHSPGTSQHHGSTARNVKSAMCGLGHILDNPQYKGQKKKTQKQQTNVAPHVIADLQEQPANPPWLKDCPNKCQQKKSSSGNEQLGAKKPEHREAERTRRCAAGIQITND